MRYVGRFAPSPTGPLHLGSLLTAVASYLHARQRHGDWLVRVEDIDPPREAPGAADAILRTLEAFDLEWDGAVCYQSTRLRTYSEAAASLLEAGLAFRCRCSRSELRAGNEGQAGRYPGTCRERQLPPGDVAVRVRVEPGVVSVTDALQGSLAVELSTTLGDYIVIRRDGLPAYHLAVVLDDVAQGISDVVRGVDLLDSTPVHVHLQHTLGLPTPRYYHVPLVVNALGQKLSKQTGAAAVIEASPDAAVTVLQWLGLVVPGDLRGARPRALWQWAIPRVDLESLRGIRSVTAT